MHVVPSSFLVKPDFIWFISFCFALGHDFDDKTPEDAEQDQYLEDFVQGGKSHSFDHFEPIFHVFIILLSLLYLCELL